MRYVSSLFLVLMGCGQIEFRQPVSVDPQLAPYMATFSQEIGVSSDGISANFADTEDQVNPLGETIGECVTYSDGTRIIQIDTGYWKTAAPGSKKELMYHELGHCALFLQHINTFKSDTCPVSIMWQFEFGESPCFASETAYYISELKTHALK